MAQPKMGLIRYLLDRTFYPDNEWTRNRDGSPIRPYDMATDTMFEYMGVRVDPVDELGEVAMEKVAAPIEPAGKVTRGGNGYSTDGRLNDSFRAMNLLFDKGVPLRRVDKAVRRTAPRRFRDSHGLGGGARGRGQADGRRFHAAARQRFRAGAHEMKRQRIAMYQRFGGGNIDEGWTRLVLEQFNFPYTSIFDPEIKAGNLIDKYDVLVIPNDATATITGDTAAGEAAAADAAAAAEERCGGGSGRRGRRRRARRQHASGVPHRHRRRRCHRDPRVRPEGRHPGHAQCGDGLPGGSPRHRCAQRARGKEHEGILVPRLHAEESRSTTRIRWHTECRPTGSPFT